MLNEFVALAKESPGAKYGGGASAGGITAAEAALGVQFPKSFKHFLAQLGWFESAELEVYGLGPEVPKHLRLVACARKERIAWNNLQKMPPGLVPIIPDGRGGHYCLDTGTRTSSESPVVYWDHELLDGSYRPSRAAVNFATFFRRMRPKRKRTDPKVITAEVAYAKLARDLRRWCVRRLGRTIKGASRAAIKRAERVLRTTIPEQLMPMLRDFDWAEHAGGWILFGVSATAKGEFDLVSRTRAVRRASPDHKHFIAFARTNVGQIACVDPRYEPLSIVAIDENTLKQQRDCEPITIEAWCWRMGKGELDPWHPLLK